MNEADTEISTMMQGTKPKSDYGMVKNHAAPSINLFMWNCWMRMYAFPSKQHHFGHQIAQATNLSVHQGDSVHSDIVLIDRIISKFRGKNDIHGVLKLFWWDTEAKM